MTTAIQRRDGDELQLGLFRLARTGLIVDGDPTFDEWQDCGRTLQRIEGAVQFWIGDWLNYGEKPYGTKYETAIDQKQLETWTNYAWVARQVTISTRVENLSWAHHREIAKFDDTTQQKLLALAAPLPGTTTPRLSVSEFKAVIRTFEHNGKIAAIAAGRLTAGEYDVVCADPPWQYDNSGFTQSAAAHYPVLDVDAIAALPTTDPTFPKFADPCVLFLWATSPLLPAAQTVMTAWGFEYKACLVWVKDRAPGVGWWLNTRHELLLIGARGSSIPIEKVDSVITATVAEHSRKPLEAYAAIDRMYPPGLRRVECFARGPRENWDVWGNEV